MMRLGEIQVAIIYDDLIPEFTRIEPLKEFVYKKYNPHAKVNQQTIL
jgi:hypothetical protein